MRGTVGWRAKQEGFNKYEMTVEDQIWNELVSRKRFCTPRQISRKLRVPHATVRAYMYQWTKRQLLDVIVKDKQNFYRIKE